MIILFYDNINYLSYFYGLCMCLWVSFRIFCNSDKILKINFVFVLSSGTKKNYYYASILVCLYFKISHEQFRLKDKEEKEFKDQNIDKKTSNIE